MSSEDQQRLEMLEASLLLTPKDRHKWVWLARLQRKLERRDDARASYQRALKIDATFAEAHHGLGLLDADQGNAEAAEASFTQALQGDPRHFGARDELAKRREQEKQWPEAAEHLEVMAEVKPEHIETRRRAARAWMHIERFDQAVGHLTVALETAPDDHGLRGELGRCLVAQGEWQAADDCFRALPREGYSIPALLALARTHEHLEQLSEARQVYQQVLKQEPQHLTALRGAATSALAQRDFESARDAFERALAVDSTDPVLFARYAEALRELGRNETALEACSRGIELDPSGAACHLGTGLALLRLKRFDEAVSSFERTLRHAPESLPAFVGLAEAHERLNQGERAVLALQGAVKVDPDDAQLHERLGQLLLRLEHTARAAKSFEEAVRLAPQSATALRGVGKCALDLERFEAAVEALRQAVELAPDDLLALAYLGRAWQRLERWEEAAECFERGTRTDPSDPALWYELGVSRTEAKQWPAALAAFERSQALEPSERARRGLATALVHLARFEDAVRVLDELVVLAPDDAALFRELGRSLQRVHELERARDALKKAAALRRTDASYQLEYGQVCLLLSEYDAAAAALEVARQLQPGDAQISILLGQAYHGLERFADAVSILQPALAQNAANAEGHRALGRALVALDRSADARRHYETALQITSDDGAVHHELGEVLFRLGELDTAVSHLKQATLLCPDSLEAYRALGRAYAKQGKHQDALVAYRQLLRHQTSDRGALLELADANQALGREEDALEALEQAQALSRDQSTALRIGLSQAKLGRDSLAVETLSSALGDEPEEWKAYAVLAECQRRLRHAEAALHALERAARLSEQASHESAFERYELLGLALAEASREPQAIETLEHAIELGSRSSQIKERLAALHRSSGIRSMREGNFASAAKHLEFARKSQSDPELFHALAQCYLEQDRADEAIELLEQGKTTHPTVASLSTLLGHESLRRKDFDKAYRSYQHSLSIRPDSFDDAWGMAQAAAGAGRRRDAIAALEQAISLRPEAIEAHEQLGLHYYEEGRFQEALNAWRTVLEARPLDAEASYRAGSCQRELHDDRAAASFFERALAQQPNRADARFELGAARARLEAWDAAVPELERVLEIAPNHQRARALLGRALAKLERDEQAADVLALALRDRRDGELLLERARCLERLERWPALESATDELLALTPTHEEALQLRARALRAQHRDDEAAQALGLILSHGSSPEAARALGELLQDRAQRKRTAGEPLAAAQAYREALALDPQNATLYLRLAETLQTAGEVQAALEATQAGLEVDRKHTELWVLSAELFSRGGLLEESRDAYRNALELEPLHRTALLGIATVYERQSEWELASEALREAARLDAPEEALKRRAAILARLEQDPERIDVLSRLHEAGRLDENGLYQLATLLESEKRYEEAASIARLLLDSRPDDVDSLSLLGTCECARERYQDAVPPLERLVQQVPDHAAGWALLGRTRDRLGDPKRAIEPLERALSLNEAQPSLWAALEQNLERLERYQEQARALTSLVELQPEPLLQRKLGLLLKRLGDAAAGQVLEAAYEALPQDLELARELASFWLDQVPEVAGDDELPPAQLDDVSSALRRAVECSQHDGPLLTRAARELQRAGLHQDARRAVARAVELLPDDTRALILQGQLYAEAKQFEAALASFQRAIEHQADAVDALRGAGECWLMLSKPKEATTVLRRATTQVPDDPSLWALLTRALEQAGDLDAAAETQRRVVTLRLGVPSEQTRLADLLMTAERFQDSVDVLSPVWQADSTDPSLGLRLARSLVQVDRIGDAVDVAERALSQVHDEPPLTALLNEVYAASLARLDRIEDAIDAYERALAAGATNVKEPLAELLRRRADELQKADAKAASTLYQRALELTQEDPETLLQLARSRRAANERQAALQAAKAAVTLKPDHIGAQLLVGQLESDLGRDELAAEAFQAALDLEAESSEAWLGLGLARVRLQTSDAIDALRRSVELHPTKQALTALLTEYRTRGDTSAARATLEHLRKLGPLSIEHTLELSRLQVAAGAHAEAMTLLDGALASNPDDPALLLLQAETLLALGRPSPALDSLHKLEQCQPRHESVHGLLGRALTQLNRREEAAAAYRAQVELTPSPEWLEALADSLGALGAEEERSRVLARWSRVRPDDAETLLRIGRAHATVGRIDEAIVVLERGSELAPDHEPIGDLLGRQLLAKAEQEAQHHNVQAALLLLQRLDKRGPPQDILLALARLYEQLGQPEPAQRAVQSWLHHAPRDTEGLVFSGTLYAKEQDWPAALEQFERALSVNLESASALRGAAQAHLQLNQPEAAAEKLIRAVRLDLSNDSLSQAAIATAAQAPREKAEALLRELTALLPDNALAKRTLALVLSQSDNAFEALALLETATKLEPRLADGWVQKAAVLERLGRFAEAEQAAKTALSLEPQRADALAVLGVAKAQTGDVQEALASLERAFEKNPDPALAEQLIRLYRERGLVQAQAGEHDAAVQCFERAIRLGSAEPDVRIALAQSLLALGQSQRVTETLSGHLEKKRDQLPGWLALGEALYRSKLWDRAGEAFEEAERLAPDSFEALRGKARVDAQRNRVEAAAQGFERALAREPNATDVRRELIRVYETLQRPETVLTHLRTLRGISSLADDEARRLGVLLARFREDAEADEVLSEIVARGLADIVTLQALSEVKERRDPSSALPAAERLVELDPTHVDGWVRLARARRASSDRAGAEVAFRRALALRADSALLRELAELQANSEPNRIETLRQLAEQYPEEAEHHALLGLALAESGHPEARRVLERAVSLGASSNEVTTALYALSLDEAERTESSEQAEQLARRAAELRPRQVAPGLFLATLYETAKRTEDAKAELRNVLQIEPEHGEALFRLGRLEQRSDQLESAVEHLRRAAELNQRDTQALRHLAETESQLSRPGAAIATYRALLERDAEDLSAHRQLIRLLSAEQKYTEAIDACTTALARCPSDVPLKLDLARSYHKLSRTDEAVLVLDGVLEQEADNVAAHRLKVDVLRTVSDHERMLPSLQCLAERTKTREHWLELEQCARQLHRLDLCVAALRELTQLTPERAPEFARLGEALSETGKVDEGMAWLERAVSLDPTAGWIQQTLVRTAWNAARTARTHNELSRTCSYYQKALTHAPDNAALHFELAVSLRSVGDTQRARAEFHETLRAASKNPEASEAFLKELGATLFELQSYQAAAQAYALAARLHPRELELQRSLISALLHAGERAEAIQWLHHALALAPRDESLLFSLGIQYALLGRTSDVHNVWNTLRPINPDLAQQLLAQSSSARR